MKASACMLTAVLLLLLAPAPGRAQDEQWQVGSTPSFIAPATIQNFSGGFSRNGPSSGMLRGVSHSPVSRIRSTANE